MMWSVLVSLGVLIGALHVVRRERRRVRKALERGYILAAAVEQSPAVVGITDLEGRIEYINPAFQNNSGYTLKEAFGKKPSILKSGITPDEVYVELWKTITGGGVWTGELCNKHKDGSLYWERASIGAIQNRQGEITHYVKVAEEITAQKKANAALASSEKRFRSVFEQASVGMALVDRQGHWQKVNDRFCEIVGYSHYELVGNSFLDITPEEDHAKEDGWSQAFESGELTTANLEKRYLHKAGHEICVDITATLVRDEVGAPQYYLCLIKDITRLRLAEQEAFKRQNQLAHLARIHTLQQMTSELAHEIDQPLCAILAASQAGLRLVDKNDCEPPPDLIDALKIVASQAERAGKIVDGIRKFSRFQGMENEVFDLNRVIHEACDLMAADLRGHRIELKLDLDDQEELPVIGNPVQIQQVVVNLCRNGTDAMMEDETPVKILSIASSRNYGVARVSVGNTGPTIGAEIAEKIFTPFFTTRENGLGLGLSLSRSIVEAHNGQLWVEPEDEQGAVFQITIPLHD